MKIPLKAIICGVFTEAIATSFVVLDDRIGIVAAGRAAGKVTGTAAQAQVAFDQAVQTAPHAFYFLAQWLHWPAVVLLGVLDRLVETMLGLSGSKPLFFDGFGGPNPEWGIICLTQAFIWIAFWTLVFFAAQSIHRAFATHRSTVSPKA